MRNAQKAERSIDAKNYDLEWTASDSIPFF